MVMEVKQGKECFNVSYCGHMEFTFIVKNYEIFLCRNKYMYNTCLLEVNKLEKEKKSSFALITFRQYFTLALLQFLPPLFL